MDEPIEELMTVSQVARLCRLRPATVYSAVSRNLIPAVVLWKGKRRRVVRFRRCDIEAFIRERATSVGTKASTHSGVGSKDRRVLPVPSPIHSRS